MVSWRLRFDLLTRGACLLRLLSASLPSFWNDVFLVFLLNGRVCCRGETFLGFFSFCSGESRSSTTFGAVRSAAGVVLDDSIEPSCAVPESNSLDKADLDTDSVPVKELKDKRTRSDSFLYDTCEVLFDGQSMKSTPSKLSVIAVGALWGATL